MGVSIVVRASARTTSSSYVPQHEVTEHTCLSTSVHSMHVPQHELCSFTVFHALHFVEREMSCKITSWLEEAAGGHTGAGAHLCVHTLSAKSIRLSCRRFPVVERPVEPSQRELIQNKVSIQAHVEQAWHMHTTSTAQACVGEIGTSMCCTLQARCRR